jgi:hypothetical protein
MGNPGQINEIWEFFCKKDGKAYFQLRNSEVDVLRQQQ